MGVRGENSRLDDLARDLANGSISRRTALRRLAAGALGIGLAATPSALADELERARCPKSRRCKGKCCPKGARCKNGKCKCTNGRVKCGRKCVDLQTSIQNCGACGTVCATGEICENRQCVAPPECTTANDCPNPGDVCENGVCVAPNLCGNGQIDGTEECDGGNLDGATCVSLGFTGGVLACSPGCSFDTSGCTSPEGCGSRACGQAPNGDDCGTCGVGQTCDNGQCLCVPSCAPGTCGQDDGCGGICSCGSGEFCSGGVCVASACTPGQTRPCYSGPPGTEGIGVCQAGTQTCTIQSQWGACQGQILPSAETCDGLDNNCDGQVDEGFGLGEQCQCGNEVGVIECSQDGTSSVCVC